MSIDPSTLPEKSPLLSPDLEAQLSPLLAGITAPFTLVCIGDDGEKSLEMATFLNHFTKLCPRLSLRLLSPGEDPAADEALDASLLPATGFCGDGGLGRAVFHGVPGGKEITGFLSALLTFGGAGKPLDRATLKDIARIKNPLKLQICVSLACHHCAQEVMNAQRVAAENPAVTAHMIDANLYPALVERYSITRVPVLLCNGEIIATGGMTMVELCNLLRKH